MKRYVNKPFRLIFMGEKPGCCLSPVGATFVIRLFETESIDAYTTKRPWLKACQSHADS